MKRNSHLLQINKPCEQDWTSMTKTDTGKFCSACSKTVVDFTKLKDDEIIQILEQTSGKLCGRLTQQQLNRVLEIKQPPAKSRLYQILVGLLLVGTTESSYARDQTPLQTEIVSINKNNFTGKQAIKAQEEPITDSLKNFVQGRIFDADTKKPLELIPVFIEYTKIKVVSGSDGKFKLVIPDTLLNDKINLVVTCTGYEKIELIIDQKDLPITKDFFMTPAEIVLTGEVCIRKRWWQFWKRR